MEAALSYAARGYLIFPLHTPTSEGKCSCPDPECENVGKHPRTPNGMKDATTDLEQIKRWWTQWPDANIGRRPSKTDIVLDLDGEEGKRFLNDPYGIPVTPTIATGKGIHAVLKNPTTVIARNRAKYLPGLDIRTHEGYHILPPSLHKNGKIYTWVMGPDTPLAEGPEWLLKILSANEEKVREYHPENGKITAGARNETLFSMAKRDFYDGVPAPTVLERLLNSNISMCTPPLLSSEVKNIVKSAEKFGKAKISAAADTNTDSPNLFRKKVNSKGVEEFTVDRASIAEHILKTKSIITMRDSNGKDIYVYQPDGTYHKEGSTYLGEAVQLILKEATSNNVVTEIIGTITRLTYRDRATLNPPLSKICVSNGVLDIENQLLEPHTPAYFFTNTIPPLYNPDASCPKIAAFLHEVMPGWEDTFYEFLGFSLHRKYSYEVFFILVGGGRNGKTRVTMLIQKFLGEENISTVGIQYLDDRFRKASLFGKLANVADDLSSEAVKHAGALKELTGGGMTQGENKFGNPFNFSNYAKLFYTCNEIPRFGEDTVALFRRPVVIRLPNVFSDNPGEGEFKADSNIIEKITTPEEMSGLLNKALEGLSRLQKNGCFSNVGSIEDRRLEIIEESDPVKFFAIKFVYFNEDYMITKGDLYQAYANYCWSIKKTPIADNWFSKNVSRHLPYVSEGMIDDPLDFNDKPRKIRVWHGIAFTGGASDTNDTHFLALKFLKNLKYGVIISKGRVISKNTVSCVSQVSETPAEEEPVRTNPQSNLDEVKRKEAPKVDVEVVKPAALTPQPPREPVGLDYHKCHDCGAVNATIIFRNMNLCPDCMSSRCKGGVSP